MRASPVFCASFVLLVAGCADKPGPAPVTPQATAQQPVASSQPPAAAPSTPPAVLTGDGELACTISAKENGNQKLVMKNGSGLEFEAVVSPIVDGTVQTKGPEKGGNYKFTSHLAKPATGTLAGVGEVNIEELETKVAVEMDRYKQPGGPGTELTFHSADMSRRGIYIEFSGKARSKNGDHYAFRVNLGAPGDGSGGTVKPQDANDNSRIQMKRVVVFAPATTVVTTTLQKIP